MKIGDRVIPSEEGIQRNKLEKDCEGIITDIDSEYVYVNWDNGKHSGGIYRRKVRPVVHKIINIHKAPTGLLLEGKVNHLKIKFSEITELSRNTFLPFAIEDAQLAEIFQYWKEWFLGVEEYEKIA